MSNVLLSGLTTITTFSLLGDGWDSILDLFDDVRKVGCWFHKSLPENKFIRVVIYTAGSVIFLRSLPFLLRATPFFQYCDQEAIYFHRGNNRKEILEFKHQLLAPLKTNEHNLPLFHDNKLVILELNIGGGTNLSYYPRDSYVIGTDILENSKEQIETNLLYDQDEGPIQNFRFLHTVVEELNSIPDNCVSCVISFHALCSTYKTSRALKEIQRVLMPGGKLYFIEHVAVRTKWTRMWIAQMNFRPSLISLNCSINSIDLALDDAGFSDIHYKRTDIGGSDLRGPLKALIPHIYGYATK